VRLSRTAPLAAIALCALAAPAHAAFAPDLRLAVAPGAAGTAPALTVGYVHPATESPVERFTLDLPRGFGVAGAPGVATGGRIGIFIARVGRGVPVAGVVRKTGPNGFGFVLSLFGGTVRQAVEGAVVRRPDGSVELRFDRLPALPLTALTVRLYGGPAALVSSPKRCGTYAVDGKFTSTADDFAIDRTAVPIGTCGIRIANLRLSDRAFEAGGSRAGYRTIIAWWASTAVDHTDVRIERRRSHRKGWRLLGVLVTGGAAGDNTLRWDGRLEGRELTPGRYRARIHPAGGRPAKRVRFRIVG